MIRPLLQFGTTDSTRDINDRYRDVILPGLYAGGVVTPVTGSLVVEVSPFHVVGKDGIAAREDAATRLTPTTPATAPNDVQYLVLELKYELLGPAIAELKFVDSDVWSDPVASEYFITFAKFEFSTSTPVDENDYTITTLDADLGAPLHRSNWRESVADFASLSALSQVKTGDIRVTLDTNDFYSFDGVSWTVISGTSLDASYRKSLPGSRLIATDTGPVEMNAGDYATDPGALGSGVRVDYAATEDAKDRRTLLDINKGHSDAAGLVIRQASPFQLGVGQSATTSGAGSITFSANTNLDLIVPGQTYINLFGGNADDGVFLVTSINKFSQLATVVNQDGSAPTFSGFVYSETEYRLSTVHFQAAANNTRLGSQPGAGEAGTTITNYLANQIGNEGVLRVIGLNDGTDTNVVVKIESREPENDGYAGNGSSDKELMVITAEGKTTLGGVAKIRHDEIQTVSTHLGNAGALYLSWNDIGNPSDEDVNFTDAGVGNRFAKFGIESGSTKNVPISGLITDGQSAFHLGLGSADENAAMLVGTQATVGITSLAFVPEAWYNRTADLDDLDNDKGAIVFEQSDPDYDDANSLAESVIRMFPKKWEDTIQPGQKTRFVMNGIYEHRSVMDGTGKIVGAFGTLGGVPIGDLPADMVTVYPAGDVAAGESPQRISPSNLGPWARINGNFAGTTYSGHNISALSKIGTGRYSVTLTEPLPGIDANYSFTVTSTSQPHFTGYAFWVPVTGFAGGVIHVHMADNSTAGSPLVDSSFSLMVFGGPQ